VDEDRESLAGLIARAPGEIEARDSIIRRTEHLRLITDNNMGTEWGR